MYDLIAPNNAGHISGLEKNRQNGKTNDKIKKPQANLTLLDFFAASRQASSNTNLGFWEPCVLYARKILVLYLLCLSFCAHFQNKQSVRSAVFIIDVRSKLHAHSAQGTKIKVLSSIKFNFVFTFQKSQQLIIM